MPLWGRLVTCGGLVIRLLNFIGMFNRPIANRPQVSNLPYIATKGLSR